MKIFKGMPKSRQWYVAVVLVTVAVLFIVGRVDWLRSRVLGI